MKITKYLSLCLVALLAFACSDDDKDSSKDLSNVKLSLSEKEEVVKIPAALMNSDNQHAVQVAGYLSMANEMSQFLSLVEVPKGAKKSSNKIEASNARVAATGDHTTYTWSDEDGSYAYQISEEADAYLFEIFMKVDGSDWLRFFYAEEKKDGSEGTMKIYDILGMMGDDPSVVWITYHWSYDGDIFNFTVDSADEGIGMEMSINTKTFAGSVKYYFDGQLSVEYTWDSSFNGTYIIYDENGEVEDTIEWSA